MNQLRLFVSSPSDVAVERRRVDAVVRRVQADYEQGLEIEVIRWEESFYSARSTFQDQIASPADVDLVICILWKRLGSALPDEYCRPDGTSRTGTEFEFETAMEAALEAELPDILVYRKTESVTFSADRVDQERAELQALEGFWRRWIQNEKGHFTAGFKPFETAEQFERVLEQDLRAWLKRRFHEVTWPEAKGSPYRGLDVFDEEHAPIYFGRRRAISEVRARLIANEKRDGVGFLLIIGASGAGKSSLIRAGLIPALKESNPVEGVAGWRTLVLRPSELGPDPVQGLALLLCESGVLPELLEGDYASSAAIAEIWSAAPASAAGPVAAALRRWGRALSVDEGLDGPPDTRLLVVLDQLEELLQLEPEAQTTLLQIVDSLSRSGAVWVVATLRSDFYPQLFALPELMALKDASRQYDLTIPRPRELEDIIAGPARAAGLGFEHTADGITLAQRLLEDAEASPAALPLLEFTLDRLYQERDRETKQLTVAAYERLGGLQGALTRTAEEAFSAVIPRFHDAPDAVFARVMRELVAIDSTRKATRRVARRDRFDGHVDDRLLVETLLERRLVTAYQQDAAERGEAAAVVNITHEALIHHWERMQRWLEEDQELLQVRERISLDCQRWVDEAGRADLLASAGKRLVDVCFLEASGLEFDEEIAAYIAASLSRAATIGRRKRMAQIVFGTISALALVFGVITLYSLDEIEQQRRTMEQTGEELTRSRAESAGLIAESEFAVGRALRAQGDAAGALASYAAAMRRASESSALRRRRSVAERDSADLFDVLIGELGRPRWPTRLDESTRIAAGAQQMPVPGPRGRHALLVSREERGSPRATLVRVADGATVAGPFVADVRSNAVGAMGVAFSPTGDRLLLVVRGDGAGSAGAGVSGETAPPARLRVLDIEAARFEEGAVEDLPGSVRVVYLDDSTILIGHEGEFRAWDGRGVRAFAQLPPAFSTALDGYSRADRIDGNTVLAAGRDVWRREGSAWRRLLAIEQIETFAFAYGVYPTARGFVAGVVEQDSLVPLSVVNLFAGQSGRIFDLLPLRTRPALVRVDLSASPPTSQITALPVPEQYAALPRGYLTDLIMLRDATNGELDLFVAFLSVRHLDRMEWFYYRVDAETGEVRVGPQRVRADEGEDFDMIAGHAFSADRKQLLVAGVSGRLRQHRIGEEGEGVRIRLGATKFGTWLVQSPDRGRLFLTDERGAYLVDGGEIFAGREDTALRVAAARLVEVSKGAASVATLPGTDEEDRRDLEAVHGVVDPGPETVEPATRRAPEVAPDWLVRPARSESGGIVIRAGRRSVVVSEAAAAPVRLAGNPARVIVEQAPRGFVLSADRGRAAVLQADSSVSVVDLAGARVEATARLPSRVRRLAVSDDGRWLAAALENSTLHIEDLDGGRSRSLRLDAGAPPTRLRLVSEPPALLVGDWGGGLTVHRLDSSPGSGKARPEVLVADGDAPISAVDAHRGADRVVAGDRAGRVRIWSLATGTPVAGVLEHEGAVVSARLSASGEWLAVATDHDRVWLWRAADGRALGEVTGLDGVKRLREAYLSPDDRTLLLSTSRDGRGGLGTAEVTLALASDRVAGLVEFAARGSLWRHGVSDEAAADTDGPLAYYVAPPATDRSYWTALLSLLASCNGASACADRSALTELLSNAGAAR